MYMHSTHVEGRGKLVSLSFLLPHRDSWDQTRLARLQGKHLFKPSLFGLEEHHILKQSLNLIPVPITYKCKSGIWMMA